MKVIEELKGYLFVILSTVTAAISVVVMKLNISSFGTEPTAFYNFLFAFVIVVSIMAYKKKLRETWTAFKENWVALTAIGILNAFAAISFFYGLSLVTATLLGFLLRFSTVFAVILSILFLGERFNKLEAIGGAIAIAGAFLISYSSGEAVILGIASALITSGLFAVSQIIMKKNIGKMSPMKMNTIRLFFMLLITGAFVVFTNTFAFPGLETSAMLFISALTAPVLSFYLVLKAMEKMELSKVSIIGSFEAFTIALFSFIAFGEILQGFQLGGSILIFLGVVILILARKKPKVIVARRVP